MLQKRKKIELLLAFIIINTCFLAFLLVWAKRQEINQKTLYSEIVAIHSVEDYFKFSEKVASGVDYQNCLISLESDLDFSGIENISPIGNENTSFAGVFDGNSHVIFGMYMNLPEQNCGMFGNLNGIVKNLQMKECVFYGKTVGAIAAETYNGAILNCYVDAEVQGEQSGTVVGKLHGNLWNCVLVSGEAVGELKKGSVEQVYYHENVDVEALNANLTFLSGYYDEYSFYPWEYTEGQVFSVKKADLLETLTARLEIKGKELNIHGYYSGNDRSWCFVLPAGFYGEKLTIQAKTSGGGYEQFYRNHSEEEIIFQWGDHSYPIRFLSAENIDTLYVSLEKQKDLSYVQEHKKEENPSILTIIDQEGRVFDRSIKGFYGHGNDSWAVEKKSYNLKLNEPADLLGIGADEDFSLLACYRDNSLMCYCTTTELCKELGFDFAPQFRLVNLYVQGEYAGVYFLAEKVELDENRINIDNSYESLKKENHNYLQGFELQEWKDSGSKAERYYYKTEKEPKDLTGGYLLEADIVDYEPEESRFVSERGIPLTMKRARYSSEAQVNYIADFWQEFEDALFAENGINEIGKHYTEYIDLESFAMQWLIYELVQEGSMSSSIYFYKESNVTGDGLLHACFPWDMEHSYIMSENVQNIWNLTEKSETLYGYWKAFAKHEDFMQELSRVWKERFVPAIDTMIAEESIVTESGMKNLRWYEEQMEQMSHLENSRWRKMNPQNRCQINREFLQLRKEILSRWLAE